MKKATKEIWKPITRYNKYYSISNFGKIRRDKPKQGTTKNYILKNKISKNGYLYVLLCRNSLHENFYVHDLVAKMFIGEKPKNREINHIDGDKLNNKKSNLQYVTRSENCKHAIKNGLIKMPDSVGENNGRAKLSVVEIKIIRNNKENSYKDLAKKFKVSISQINRIKNNRAWRNI